MILEGNVSNEDILDQLEKIEALEEDNRNHLYHENTKIEVWSGFLIVGRLMLLIESVPCHESKIKH